MKFKKKGQIGDIPLIIIILIAFGIVTFFSLKVLNAWDSSVATYNSDQLNNAVYTNVMAKAHTTLNSFDYLLIFIILGLFIFTAISAVYISSNPALFWIFLFVLIFFIIIAAIFGNVFSAFTASPDLAEEAATLDIISYLLGSKIVLIIFALIVILLIALYAKTRQGAAY